MQKILHSIETRIHSLKSKLGIIGEFLNFLWVKKLWWLIPLLFILVLIGFVLVISHGSVLAPFIYTLF